MRVQPYGWMNGCISVQVPESIRGKQTDGQKDQWTDKCVDVNM